MRRRSRPGRRCGAWFLGRWNLSLRFFRFRCKLLMASTDKKGDENQYLRYRINADNPVERTFPLFLDRA